MSSGYLALVLHAHLPFVRHPEHRTFLEERWLFEALTETYLPLLRVFSGLAREGVPARIAWSISPSLLAMLEDPLLRERYEEHLDRLVDLTERELERTRSEPQFLRLAGLYHRLFREARSEFAAHGGRLARPFLDLHRQGVIELGTTAATHGILPLLLAQPRSVEAQLTTGFDYFESVFGFRPSGMWLPECAYTPGLDEVLRRHGVRHFIVESHGIDHASVAPLVGVHAPLYTPSGVAAFGRDQGSTREVWSAQHGFPGDPDYREFYRDIGFDLDPEYVKSALGGGVRGMTGIKYYRITGPTNWKAPYDPEAARRKADLHASVFLERRTAHLEYLASLAETAPIIVAPFDAELFGHWWFEGPVWLDLFLRKAAYDQRTFQLTTLGAYLDRHPVHQTGQPGTSTWGSAGYFDTWLNGKTDWIFEHLLGCAHRMERLVTTHGRSRTVSPLVKRVLDQCLRELLLAQSSDWPFIISNGTSAEYAERRVRDHVSRFHWLANALESGEVDEEKLGAIEYLDNLFPAADFRAFAAPPLALAS
ncbi:MAG: DUF1957 domain-containing protein [Polyangiaceae bacterium]|nr:DUF1957 domain-containing protein [Polyangiaceae bacterium]